MPDEKSQHGLYLIALIVLTIGTLLFSALILTFPVLYLWPWLSYALIAIIAYGFGFVCSKNVENITHKEKKEILAGTVIPLPTVIAIMVFTMIGKDLLNIINLNPFIASALYFIMFNIPFLVYFYEHETHKHHLIAFMIAPMIMLVMYSLTFLMISSMSSYYTTSSVLEETLSGTNEFTGVDTYITQCLKTTLKDKIIEGFEDEGDINSYILKNFPDCINNFRAFESQDYEFIQGSMSAKTLVTDLTIVSDLEYPLTIKKGEQEKSFSRFKVIIER